MGLAGPRKRAKLSQDPNNTNWSRSETNFGRKILASQGWKPGDYLGAKDANHSSHYSAANASHIRVLLKDDNLGLGAKRGTDNAETFGLSQFSGLLGRLNGKSDDVLKKETDARRDVELRLWQGRKHGVMNFVSAGFLVGDKIEEKPRVKSIKEMRAGMGATDQGVVMTQKVVDEKTEKSAKREKKSSETKKRKRISDDQDKTMDTTVPPSAASDLDTPTAPKEKECKEARRARKAEKAARKLARQQRRDAKAARKAAKESKTKSKLELPTTTQTKAEAASSSDSDSDSDSEPLTSTLTSALTSLPASVPTSGTSTPTTGSIPRHAVRQRYIAQKRMAGMDPRALKEIFMIKT